MSSPDRSRNGSAGCRIAGSALTYPACANDNSSASAHAADPVALAAVWFIAKSQHPSKFGVGAGFGAALSMAVARFRPGTAKGLNGREPVAARLRPNRQEPSERAPGPPPRPYRPVAPADPATIVRSAAAAAA